MNWLDPAENMSYESYDLTVDGLEEEAVQAAPGKGWPRLRYEFTARRFGIGGRLGLLVHHGLGDRMRKAEMLKYLKEGEAVREEVH